jgi:hypothetical protein
MNVSITSLTSLRILERYSILIILSIILILPLHNATTTITTTFAHAITYNTNIINNNYQTDQYRMLQEDCSGCNPFSTLFKSCPTNTERITKEWIKHFDWNDPDRKCIVSCCGVVVSECCIKKQPQPQPQPQPIPRPIPQSQPQSLPIIQPVSVPIQQQPQPVQQQPLPIPFPLLQPIPVQQQPPQPNQIVITTPVVDGLVGTIPTIPTTVVL